MNKDAKGLSFLSFIMFIVMVAINILANTLPINGVTTAQVSDSYPNLFAPIGFTFSIWFIIYLALLLYSIYQIRNYKKEGFFLSAINRLFIISSLFNILWILSWHYKKIGLSTIFIILILVTLYRLNMAIEKNSLNSYQYRFTYIPFSIYLGWITVASLANIVSFLVSIGIDGYNIFLNTFFIVLGLLLAMFYLIIYKNVFFGLSVLWAYIGILTKHIKVFDMEYKLILVVVGISIIMLVYEIIKTAVENIRTS